MSGMDKILLKLESSECLERQLMGLSPQRLHAPRPPTRRKVYADGLTPADVRLVRQLWAAGEPERSIAQKFEVRVGVVRGILERHTRTEVR